ncbi:MAG: histidine ammonia-lyase [Phycisphaerales bacterium]|nr:histidine ammonia-lyase [Phycisphaerales bacterium]
MALATPAPNPSRLPPLILDAGPLTTADVESVARGGRPVELGSIARGKIESARAIVEHSLTDGRAHYGINTGFGSLSRQRISSDALRDVQRNLVRSHAAGVGALLPSDVVRAMMLLLAASLARGHSGVRAPVVETLIAVLNAGITPEVPGVGSVGASGDLAPLAHVALVLMGEGRASYRGGSTSGAEALRAAGIPPLTLEAKEGLALINGTHLMAARGALLIRDFGRLFDAAMAAAAMSLDACRATDAFLDDRVHGVRGQPGPRRVAEQMRGLLTGSQIIPSHRENDPRVQDPYSLRCSPQVLGAAWDAAAYAASAIQAELGAVTDNPLVFAGPGEAIVSAGNFHGMPLAIPLDTLTIALSHIAGIAERRVFLMLAAFDSEMQLRPYLSPSPGLHSGLMIAQYTAAACCNEIIGLAGPASVANIPTSAGMEDYNSFGPRAAAKAARATELARLVVAIELLCAAQAIEAHRPLRSGDGIERVISRVRTEVPSLTQDRPLTADIESIASMVERGDLAPNS